MSLIDAIKRVLHWTSRCNCNDVENCYIEVEAQVSTVVFQDPRPTYRKSPNALPHHVNDISAFFVKPIMDHPRCQVCGNWVTALGFYDFCGSCDAKTRWYE